MTNEFKKILLQVAKLPKKDQHWILKQLSKTQGLLFRQAQGFTLLRTARRYSKLPISLLPEIPQECETLEPEKNDLQCSQETFNTLKAATQQALLTQWRLEGDFAAQLEVAHG